MALPKLYDRITWHNNTTPALNEDNLNAMSKGLDDVDDRLIDLAGTIMEDVPQIIEDMAILEPAIESIDENVARAEAAAESAEQYAEEIAPPIEVVKDYADIITVEDAINKPVKDLKVKVDPVQDLHGYTKPWVGGAGKNKANIADAVVTEAGYVYNNAPLVLPSGTYTFSFESTATSGDYTIVFRDADNTELARANKNMGVKYATFTLASACAKFTLAVSATGTYSHFQIEVGSTATTYESYTNICPITGWTEANVYRTGKQKIVSTNLKDTDSYANFTITKYDGGRFSFLGNNGSSTYGGVLSTDNTILLRAGHTYRLKGNWSNITPSESTIRFDLRYYNGVSTTAIYMNENNESYTPTVDTYCSLGYRISGNYSFPAGATASPCLTMDDTDTSYAPYQGEELTIDLGGTRYGALVDYTRGGMTLTKGIKTIGELEWGITNDYFYTLDITNKKAGNTNLISSAYKTTTSDTVSGMVNGEIKGNASNYNVYLKDFSCADATALVANRGTEQIVYELATPQTIQLTAEEVELLLGYNTLWADTGDLSLTYDASGVLRIANAKLDIDTFKSVVAASSDFADFKSRVAAL